MQVVVDIDIKYIINFECEKRFFFWTLIEKIKLYIYICICELFNILHKSIFNIWKA